VNVALVLALAYRFQGRDRVRALIFERGEYRSPGEGAHQRKYRGHPGRTVDGAQVYAEDAALFGHRRVPAIFADRAVLARVGAAHSRLVAAGVPLVVATLVFAAVGIASSC